MSSVFNIEKPVYWIDRVSRCLTRTGAVAGIIGYAVLIAVPFRVSSGTHGGGASAALEIESRIFDLVGLTSLFSIAASVPAVVIFSYGKVWEHRTIHWYIVLSMITLLLLAMMPVRLVCGVY
ncbi:MAG: hypothetical protein WCB27_12665 [Thermoguttaceae bacterium]|jgi:hypothetical protein